MIPSPCKPDCPGRNMTCKSGCNKWKLYEIVYAWHLGRLKEEAEKTQFSFDVRRKVAKRNERKRA